MVEPVNAMQQFHCDAAWLSLESQLAGAGELLVDCSRPDHVCVNPAFFHAASDPSGQRLTMPHPFMWNHAPPCSRMDLYTQCRKRHRDSDWPAERHEVRTSHTRTASSVLDLLGERVVTIVGSHLG